MKENKKLDSPVLVTFHELKACLLVGDETEGYVPVPMEPLVIKKDFAFCLARDSCSNDFFQELRKEAEACIISSLVAEKEIFNLFIPKVYYFDCTIDGERRIYDELAND